MPPAVRPAEERFSSVPARRSSPSARSAGPPSPERESDLEVARDGRRARPDVVPVPGRHDREAEGAGTEAVPDRRTAPALDRRGDLGRVARLLRGRPLRLARRGAGELLGDAAPAAPVEPARPGVHADRAGAAAQLRGVRPVHGDRPAPGALRLGRRRPPVRRRPGRGLHVRRPLRRRREPRDARLRRRPRRRRASSSAGRSSSTTWASKGSRRGRERKVAAKASSLNCPDLRRRACS